MLDLAVTGGLVYLEGGFRRCDLGVQNGRIAMVALPGELPGAERTLDAAGKYVLPGVVDPHVHIRNPGGEHQETFLTGSMAAAAGGVTTFFEHPISSPPPYTEEILGRRVELANGHCCVDFAFYGAAGGEFPQEIVPLAKSGIVAYKTFLQEPPAGREAEFKGLTVSDDAQLLACLEQGAKTGLMMAFHAENNAIIKANISRIAAGGGVEPLDHCRSRPSFTEYETVEKLLRYAEQTDAILEIVHVTTARSMELIKEARARGVKVYAETCPHYLLLDESDVARFGAFAKCNPPLRPRWEADALWRYVNDGTVDFLGSDHGPYSLAEKEKGLDNIFDASPGMPGIDLHLPLMLDAVSRGLLSLERLVELMCAGPARCFGIYPQKGNLAPGADADMVVADLNAVTRVDRAGSYSLGREIARVYDGRTLRCGLDYTVVRGRVVMEHGVVDPAAEGWGQWIRPAADK